MSADAAGTADVPTSALDAVLLKSVDMPEGTPTVKGYDFEGTLDLQALLDSMLTSGFQATQFGYAVDEVNKMLRWRLSDEPVPEDADEEERDPAYRAGVRTKIFLGFTSNLISSGVREQLKFLMKHKMVDVLVTTAGGVEEDLIKALAPTYLGDFSLKGATLRSQGLNRIGNLLVPNDNYCKFEDWMMPILDAMKREQDEQGVRWTPSRVIKRLGLEINDESSVYYWAAKNDIPVYCPALTDGSIGDMLYFHSFKNPGLIVDLVEDIRAMNDEARLVARPKKTGMIILGGGVAKHHINNANLMRNGADFAVSINTAQEFDGSDSGAKPDEAVSWGKIRPEANPVKVCADATLLFPLLVAQTFKKNFEPKA
jgi:deoxyhypusine synthase